MPKLRRERITVEQSRRPFSSNGIKLNYEGVEEDSNPGPGPLGMARNVRQENEVVKWILFVMSRLL